MQIEAGDRLKLHRFLIDRFGFIFGINQYYWMLIAEGRARDFDKADEGSAKYRVTVLNSL